MAIVQEKLIESKDGVKKTIDKQSMGMALDILQRGLYSFPIKSTVRELASNAHDAVKERDVAKAIIAGKDAVSDHFDQSLGDSGIYHASGWDPSYFDLKWLSDDPYVKIYYEEGNLRDVLRIIDCGVGLGGERLLGYFLIQYSSKRKNKDTLGRFGLGSKVPLSLGIESFRVINRYNGMKFKFDVYLDKIESVVPMFGAKGTNQKVQITDDKWENGELIQEAYYAYWEPTQEMNGVEVQVEVKKHHKQAFFESIESQLMYMPNILFMHRPYDSMSHITIDIAAQIAYKDNDIIISKTTVYDKPHILLGTGDVMVNYGFVAFNELEIEPKGGAVGLIMDINDIEVTPSREAPVWSTQTRAAVLAKYEKVTETATKYVNEEIAKETDYIRWIQKATSIVGSVKNGTADSTSVLATLASIIDIGKINNITYAPDKTVKLDNDLEKMFGKGFNLRTIRFERWAKKIKREPLKDLQVLNYPLYKTKIGANKYKDRYLYEENGVFVLVFEKEDADIFKHYNLINQSTAFKDYDAVIIPEDRLELYAGENGSDDIVDENNIYTFTSKDRADARKKNKEIVIHTAYKDYNSNWLFSSEDKKISDMYNVNPGATVMYGTGNDRNLMKTVLAVLPLWYTTGKEVGHYYSTYVAPKYTIDLEEEDIDKINDQKIISILVAKNNIKYISTSKRFKTPYQLLIKSYNKYTGKLVLTEEAKHIITARTLCTINNVKFKALQKEYGGSGIFYTISNSRKLRFLFEDSEEEKLAYSYMESNLFYYENLSAGVTDFSLLLFLDKLGKYQAMEQNLVISSEEDRENLLQDINNTLPEFMCTEIDEIFSIDALYLSIIEDVTKLFIKLNISWGIINLYESKYYNRYITKSKDELTKDVCYFIDKKMQDYDASV